MQACSCGFCDDYWICEVCFRGEQKKMTKDMFLDPLTLAFHEYKPKIVKQVAEVYKYLNHLKTFEK